MYLVDKKGFVPLVRPADVYDEVVFVANHTIENPTLEAIQGNEIASVTSLLPTKIALHILKERSVAPSGVVDRESWLSVMGSIWRDEVNFGVIYKDTYDELSEQGRSMAKSFFTSDEKVAFHSMVLGPKLAGHQAEMQQLLLGMDADEKGKEVLQELRLTKWLGIEQSQLDTMKQIIETY
jgi:phosphonate transport system substrate-binding protein